MGKLSAHFYSGYFFTNTLIAILKKKSRKFITCKGILNIHNSKYTSDAQKPFKGCCLPLCISDNLSEKHDGMDNICTKKVFKKGKSNKFIDFFSKSLLTDLRRYRPALGLSRGVEEVIAS